MQSVREKPDGRSASKRIAFMKRSNDPVTRQVGLILEAFASERRTEGAFYLRFCALAPMQVEALQTMWDIRDDDWCLFRRICKFFAL